MSPAWLEPNWIYPTRTTNSDFSVTTGIHDTLTTNSDGFSIYESVISNSDLQVKMTYQMLDTTGGMQMGTTPASDAGSGSVTSNRYVLSQSYEVTNISGVEISDINFFQFLHGLNSTTAVYDNRDYGGPYSAYQYDITLNGIDDWTTPGTTHDDTITFHFSEAPVAYETGYYGIEGVDDHTGVGKPGTGVHLSVEGDTLNNNDSFDPGGLWVSGAAKFSLGTLADSQSTSTDTLLSIQTTTAPEPISMLLFGAGGIPLVLRRFLKRRQS